jgi:hypothetical protein
MLMNFARLFAVGAIELYYLGAFQAGTSLLLEESNNVTWHRQALKTIAWTG